MTKLEGKIKGRFNNILREIEREILNGSISASLEDSSDFEIGDARCSVRVFERYSYMGGNRVSLNVTLFQKGDSPIHLSAITSGGSQAMFFKVNTFGEEAFLDKLSDIIDGLNCSDFENSDSLPQVRCENCGEMYDFDYPKCPYCNK